MARRTLSLTIDAEGRDRGKTFLLTEMAASAAEKWATRAMLALGRSGLEIPEEAEGVGMAGIAAAGIRAFMSLSFDDAEPLLDEMMGCVVFVPDAKVAAVTRPLIEDDIEEVATRLRLRNEVIALHTGFSPAAMLSRLGQAAKSPREDSPNTET